LIYLEGEGSFISTVDVGYIEDGECFKKVKGDFEYLKLSSSSARHYGLADHMVHGICLRNGNMTSVAPGTRVIPLKLGFTKV